MKKRKFTKIMVLLLAMVLMFSLPIEAAAAGKVTAGTSFKKAKTVKSGKTVVTTPKDSGQIVSYLKFKAPATKTYKITINNLRKYGKKSSQTIESIFINFNSLEKDGRINYLKFKQNEKKSYETLWICSQESWKYGKTKKIKAGTFIPSRTAGIRLKKGQTIYIVAGNKNYKRCYDLTIK